MRRTVVAAGLACIGLGEVFFRGMYPVTLYWLIPYYGWGDYAILFSLLGTVMVTAGVIHSFGSASSVSSKGRLLVWGAIIGASSVTVVHAVAHFRLAMSPIECFVCPTLVDVIMGYLKVAGVGAGLGALISYAIARLTSRRRLVVG